MKNCSNWYFGSKTYGQAQKWDSYDNSFEKYEHLEKCQNSVFLGWRWPTLTFSTISKLYTELSWISKLFLNSNLIRIILTNFGHPGFKTEWVRGVWNVGYFQTEINFFTKKCKKSSFHALNKYWRHSNILKWCHWNIHYWNIHENNCNKP